jgi:hypothetical protein
MMSLRLTYCGRRRATFIVVWQHIHHLYHRMSTSPIYKTTNIMSSLMSLIASVLSFTVKWSIGIAFIICDILYTTVESFIVLVEILLIQVFSILCVFVVDIWRPEYNTGDDGEQVYVHHSPPDTPTRDYEDPTKNEEDVSSSNDSDASTTNQNSSTTRLGCDDDESDNAERLKEYEMKQQKKATTRRRRRVGGVNPEEILGSQVIFRSS